VYGRHYIRQFLSATVAPGGVGKSSLSVVEALAMASGRDLIGVAPPAPLRVWYWNGEDPADEIDRRVAATCLRYGIDHSAIEGRLFRDTGRDVELIIASQARAGTLVASPVEMALTDALRDRQIDVLIIDPFVAAHRVSENDNMAIDVVAKTFGRIAGAANCAVELIHHVRKTGGAEITAEDGRGASALVAAARSVRVLNPMSKDEGEQSGIGDERRLYFRADVGKANLAPPSTKATWYRLESVALGNGDYVGVATSWTWPNAFDGVTAADLRKVQAAIAEGRWRANPQAKDWAGVAVAKVLNLDPTVKAHKAKITAMLKTWIANGMFVVVEGLDAKREKRDFIEVGTLAED
jgi:AAA domain